MCCKWVAFRTQIHPHHPSSPVQDVGNFALRAILSGRQREDVVNDIHEHLADVKDKVGPCGQDKAVEQLGGQQPGWAAGQTSEPGRQ